MEGSFPTPKRKACDLCYQKKIRCDGQQPRCSGCELYKCDCTYKAASRKVPSRKQAALQRQSREQGLQSRVETLERQLSAVLDKVDRLERSQDISGLATPACSEDAPGVSDWASSLPDIPSYHQVLPIVERYLSTFNSILPLFHPVTILQTIKSWYQNPHSRNPVTWAVTNVVLALAHYTSDADPQTLTGGTATYLNNVQSVLTDITIRETELVNVQILLGLVILFWAADDSGPALVFMGTAMRLAHKIGLQVRKSSQKCSPTLALQRNRVFWIAYILDRDISLLSGLAPVQLESEVDLDLPPLEAGDDLAGFVFAADGYTKMNYFRARIELAKIQGNVYDCVYSTGAQNLNLEERAEKSAVIAYMLDDWSSRIPLEFHTTTLLRSYSSELSRYFCMLYSTSLSCRALISFASASDSFHYSDWMQRLREYGGKIVAGQGASHAPVPYRWHALADASRDYLRLFRTIAIKDLFFIRITLCAHNSSLVSLTANRIFNHHHAESESDMEIVKNGLKYLRYASEKIDSGSARYVGDALEHLCSYADLISVRGSYDVQVTLPEPSFPDNELQPGLIEASGYDYQESLVPDMEFSWASLSDK
ncbi:fungal-specific transcription factor domain-containing protein [Xylaria grammica]|nr:fungal-specific transcription factor domain-containing protein [Xylaria grammica]